MQRRGEEEETDSVIADGFTSSMRFGWRVDVKCIFMLNDDDCASSGDFFPFVMKIILTNDGVDDGTRTSNN